MPAFDSLAPQPPTPEWAQLMSAIRGAASAPCRDQPDQPEWVVGVSTAQIAASTDIGGMRGKKILQVRALREKAVEMCRGCTITDLCYAAASSDLGMHGVLAGRVWPDDRVEVDRKLRSKDRKRRQERVRFARRKAEQAARRAGCGSGQLSLI